MDIKGEGGEPCAPSEKGHGSERNGMEKCEGFRKGSSLEREFIMEGSRGLMRKGEERDVSRKSSPDRNASDRGEECAALAKKGWHFGRDGNEKREAVKVSSSSGDNLEEEGLKILSLRALDCEKEGRRKAHPHAPPSSPSSKGVKYERLIVDTQFPKGDRSEGDRFRREDGSKLQSRDLYRGSKIIEETARNEKNNPVEKSFSDGEDAAARLTASTSSVDGETLMKDENLHDFKDSGAERSVERGNGAFPEEGSCMPRDARGDEAINRGNGKDCSDSDKSEMEEGELDPEGDDAQHILEENAAENSQISGGNQVTAHTKAKGEARTTEEEEVVLQQTQDVGTKGEANGRNNSALVVDTEEEAEENTTGLMEIGAPNTVGDELGRSKRGSEESLDDFGLKDVVRPMEVEVEEKVHDTGCREYSQTMRDVNDMILGINEKEEALIVPEIVHFDKHDNVVGTSGHLDTQELVMEFEGGHLHKKLRIEKLEPLMLSLPDTSLSLGSPGVPRAVKAPSKTRSMQSISASEAHSNGVTTSLSLSYSHPFVHNPSCSLTQTSLDNQEFSSASQQVSQCNDQLSHGSWQMSHGSDRAGGQRLKDISFDRRKPHRELPLYQQLLQNGSLQVFQGSLGVERGREALSQSDQLKRSCGSDTTGGIEISHGSQQIPPMIQQHKKIPEESQGRSLEDKGSPFERRKSFLKDLQERPCQTWSSPTQSVGSREKCSEQENSGKNRTGAEREITKLESGFSKRPPLFERNEDMSATRNSINGKMVGLFEIVTDPIPIIAKKLSELPESYVDGLKESLIDMLVHVGKREEFGQLQKILQRRTDLSSETLLRAHRAQLELLVAMKTGIQAFLHRDNSLTTSAMVEVFLQTRCRNIRCQSQLPVDDCECLICVQKNGFCSACMCVVCSKFDFDANTCRWVGCDFCMHWCHSECGLRSSYIMPGQSIQGAAGTSEMQFRCMACGQKSELFGFVKDVFTTFAQVWERDVLTRELECVRRIFHGSQDKKGKQLCEKAGHMLSNLENRADTAEVCQSMLRFFTGQFFVSFSKALWP
ncbi:hypothetical protein O6H91_Y472700 [Diphasiastrum complanatum]|nr:hypothetical protein O6H91_Y472700 [Diphasiastrum complanatum]